MSNNGKPPFFTRNVVLLILVAVAIGAAFAYYGYTVALKAAKEQVEAEKAAETKAESSVTGSSGTKNAAAAAETGSGQASGTDSSSEGLGLSEENIGSTIYYKGQKYTKKEDITSILFMGVDDSEEREMNEPIGNGGRSDVLILFVLNDADKTARMLQISRNTMTEVDIYNLDGEYVYSADTQICMQYAYGDSPLRSCYLTEKTVSELLYETEIDGYLSMTMDAISIITDLLGGVTGVLPEDYTEIDASYVKGAEITFKGDEAENFVRYRDIEELGSNEKRMERQTWFMQQLFAKLKSSPNMADLVSTMLDKADKYIETNLEAEKIRDMARYSIADEALTVPGEIKEGFAHDEYYVDEEGLQDLIVELFYEPAK